MRWRVVAATLGALVYLVVLAGAIAGSPGLAAIVVTVTALVVLVAGGNWLQHWLGIRRRAPQFARPDAAASPDRPDGPEQRG